MLARRTQLATLLLAAGFLFGLAGCASQGWVKVREVPRDPLAHQLNLLSRKGPKPTERTEQFLRRYDLLDTYARDPQAAINGVVQLIEREPTAEKTYALAELSYVHAKSLEQKGRDDDALDNYAAAVANAYYYLIDDRFSGRRNPYDPQFRRACDLYNGALESSLRMAQRRGLLANGGRHTIRTANRQYDVSLAAMGRWRLDEIDHFEFVSDYEVNGLPNIYHTYGLGVPLIAVRRKQETDDPREKFYPPRLSFPVTAFWHATPESAGSGTGRHRCVVELRDPLASTDIRVGGRLVPMESDLSTPLAYFLNGPVLASSYLATLGLLDIEASQSIKGLYMLEPYDPNKIPVLMVHGLWSSPITWVEMFNDLRGTPEIRDRYQFWFYLYPTGQPFWISAAQMREDLDEARRILDPQRRAAPLDQMVLVGHSMGGLVSRLQTLDSGDDFWRLVSDKPLAQLNADAETQRRLAGNLYFRANPSIRRVVTIATPHRGSQFSNDTTRWLGGKLIALPNLLVNRRDKLLQDNPELVRDGQLLSIDTSIDSLAPDSPILPVMLSARRPPQVRYHNIVGVLSDEGWMNQLAGRVAGRGDGVVGYDSAHLDDVVSEIVVPADHVSVHRHPRAVLEVRRILLEHLAELQPRPIQQRPRRPQVATAPQPLPAGWPAAWAASGPVVGE